MKGRIYAVAVKGEVARLVRALTASQAVKFVATPMIQAAIPSQEDLVGLGAKGVKVEDATKEAK